MNLSAIAIKRPVFTVMVTLALMVFGLLGLSRLGTDLFPDVDFPVVTVTVPYPGAAPNEVELQVTKPLEDAIVSLNGIDRMRSYSREGSSTVLIIFKLGVDLQEAATEVRERVAQVRSRLPDEVKEPSVTRLDVGATPVAIYTLSGGGRSLAETAKYARDELKPVLEQVSGVASVDVQGGAEREVHVNLDMARVDALHLSAVEVMAHLRQQNLTVPGGHFDEGPHEIGVRTIGEFKSVDEIRDVIVAVTPDGSSVRLSDIAQVEDGYEELRTRVRANGEPAVAFSVRKQSGKNTVAVADAVKAKLAAIDKTFPTGMHASLIVDTSRFIRENTHEVEVAIVFGGAMAILVILLFMLDLRSTLISAVALPTSVVSTFFLMYLLNFSLNMMTLLALSLAIGLLIDDAVVVRENISKHLERGVDPRTAALEGTKEISLSVLATTLTVVAVFLPVAFMDGIVGQFFRQFGLTIVAAVSMSLFVAFTLDPMLSSRFSKSHTGPEKWARLKAPFNAVHKGVEDVYRVVLGWAVRHKLVVGGIAILSLIMMGQLAKLTGTDFVNQEDRGQFNVLVELPAGTSLAETARLTLAAEKKILENKHILTVLSTLGPNGDENKVQWRVVAVPKDQRPEGVVDLKAQARSAALAIPGAKVAVSDPSFIEGAQQDAPIVLQVRGTNYAEIEQTGRKLTAMLKSVPGLVDVSMDFTPGRPELQIGIDRAKAALAGIPAGQIAMAVRASVEGDEGGKLRQGKDEIPIRVRLSESDRRTVDDITRMTIWTPKGPVALSDLTTVGRGEGPNVIEREDRERQIAINAFPMGRSLGDIMVEVNAHLAKEKLPPGISLHIAGQVKDMNESNSSMGLALLLAVIFIYIVLASQFESFIHPFTIMLTLPLAFVGAIVGLFLVQTSLAMGSMIGIILLMGLVTKNAILLLDRAIVRVREHGETPLQAILEAGPERLRPILMTSAAMILGMLPTAIGRGEGSEFRAPMAIAVIGGVVSSTLLSLVVVPAFYLAIEGAKATLARWFGLRPKHAVAPVAPASSPAE